MSVRACSLPAMERSIGDPELDPFLHQVLDLERSWSPQGGISKDRIVRERLGISSARYHQLLNRAIDHPASLALDPMLVLRLRRVRWARRAARSAGRLGLGASPG